MAGKGVQRKIRRSRSAKEAVQFPITEAEVKFKPLHCSGAKEGGQA